MGAEGSTVPEFCGWLTGHAKPNPGRGRHGPRHGANLGLFPDSITAFGNGRARVRLCLLTESFFGLDREADGDLRRSVENLNEMAAKHAMEFAHDSAAAAEFEPTIAGMTVRTDNIRFLHWLNMGSHRSFPSRECCHDPLIC